MERNYRDIGPKHATHWLNDALLMSTGHIALQVTENMELLLIVSSRVIFMVDPVTSWRHVVFLTIFAVVNFVFWGTAGVVSSDPCYRNVNSHGKERVHILHTDTSNKRMYT